LYQEGFVVSEQPIVALRVVFSVKKYQANLDGKLRIRLKIQPKQLRWLVAPAIENINSKHNTNHTNITMVVYMELDKTQKTYHAVLIRLMTFVNNQEYENDHDFSLLELAPLTPVDIKRFMSVEAYGTPEPNPCSSQ
jgi:hypothetical protein